MRIDFFGTNLCLDAEKSAFVPATRSLLLSDIHLGKDVHFRQRGVNIPAGWHTRDLARMSKLIHQHQVEELIVLGDFIHHAQACPDWLMDDVIAWRRSFSALEIKIILGNHDRNLKSVLGGRLDVSIVRDDLERGAVHLRHQPNFSTETPTISGHVHPVLALTTYLESFRVPCFARKGFNLVLPAFGSGTGGFNIANQGYDDAWLVADGMVIATAPK